MPIHYDGFHNSQYLTHPGELDRFLAASDAESYSVAALRQGEGIEL